MDCKKIIYQVLPRLWGNGRLSGWDKESFDYLHALGVDYIWLTGIPRHASGEPFVKGDPGSPYAVCDWYDINPYLAGEEDRRMDEFRSLLDRSHASGLKVLIDFVPNHVACNYSGGLALYDWHDADWSDTLKVDWSNPASEAEFIEILRFWARMGVDGFRCDMVELVPPDALHRVISAVRLEFPNLLFIAEVYKRENYRLYVDTVGFDLLYDKSGVYDILRGIMAGSRNAKELTWNWQFLGNLQGNMLNFLENHDEQRIASDAFAGGVEKSWASVAYAMLFNRASWMFYSGQETGENASEGADGRTSIFNWCHPRSLSHIDSYIHGSGMLEDKELDTLTRYRRLATLARSPLFCSGEVWDLCYCNEETSGFDPGLNTAFVRYNSDEAMLVFCNFSSHAVAVDVVIPQELSDAACLDKAEASLYAPAYGYALLKIK
ncbi:MAG: hypothetical protein J6O51_10260 [Bacteroidales bacterium]|nr:hypothetical protein [Bacteroidales bacterium]